MKRSTRPAPFLESDLARWNGLIYGLMLLALLVAVESSCHKRQVQIPAPPAPVPSAPAEVAPATPKPAAPQAMPPPPAIPPQAPVAGSEGVIPNPPPAPPPAPSRPSRRPNRPTTAPQAAPPPAAPAAPAPQLGIVLTEEQQRQYNAAIDQSLQHAEASLRSIANRTLSSQQRASVDEARNFIRQAQATRSTDLPGARRLAERAELLAGNLASSLH